MSKDTRYGIRRAEKEGIEVQINKNHNQFFQIYKSFLQKKGLISLFDIFGVGNVPVDILKKYGTLIVTLYNGEVLSGGIYLENNCCIKGWIGASKRFEVDKKTKRLISYSNRLIEWEAIKYAKDKGIEEFDFGGLWPENEAEIDQAKKGINSFKLGFGGNIVTRYSYQKIYSNSYNFLFKIYNFINNKRQGGNGKF